MMIGEAVDGGFFEENDVEIAEGEQAPAVEGVAERDADMPGARTPAAPM